MAEIVGGNLRSAPPGALDLVDAEVVLHDEEGDACTIVLRHGEMQVRPGRARRAATEIAGDRTTVVEVAGGLRSGVEAFLHGDLAVRGNLALALGLDGLLDHPGADATKEVFTRSGLVEANGIPTFHIEAGPADAEPIVLLHGVGATNASMLPTFYDLAADHRVVAPDLPGHGATQALPGRYDAEFFCDWLNDWMPKVGIDSAVLVGNSLGGRIGVELALRYPERVRALVGLCPAVTRLRPLSPFLRLLRPELGNLPLPLPLLDLTVRQLVRSLFAHPDQLPRSWLDAAAGEFSRCYRKPHRRVAFLSSARQVLLDEAHGPNGFWTRLRAVRQPVLCVWGDRDRLVSDSFAGHVSIAIAHSRSITFEDCGHVPQFEQPERTNGAIRNFLDELGPRFAHPLTSNG